MSQSVVGRRYGNAIFGLAKEQGKVEEVDRELSDFAATFAASAELRSVFDNPSVGQEARRKILTDIAAQAKLSNLTRNALMYLSDQGRIEHIADIQAAYAQRSRAASGEVRAEVTTASELPDAYFEALQKQLAAVTGKDVVIVRKTDPSLIGGVVTRIGDQVFDGSIKNQLQGLKEELLG